jgi:hypothetical protein
VAFEAAQRFTAALAIGLLASEVLGGIGVQAALRDGQAVQRAVELAVAATIEAVAIGVPGGCGDRCGPGDPRELGVGGESPDAGDFTDQLGGGQHAAAAFGQQPGRELGDEDGETVNSGRIAQLCSQDWGLWRTITRNLETCRRQTPAYGEDFAGVAAQFAQLEERIEAEPKSRAWRLRAKIGERKRWYELPEERR